MRHPFLAIGDLPWRDDELWESLCADARRRGAIFVSPHSVLLTALYEKPLSLRREIPLAVRFAAHQRLTEIIVRERPEAILTLGTHALKEVTGLFLTVRQARSSRWISRDEPALEGFSGLVEKLRIIGIPIFPTYHPRDMVRKRVASHKIVEDLIKAFISVAF